MPERGSLRRNPLRLLCVLGSLPPLYLVLVYVASYASPFPVDDQWMRSFLIAIGTADGTVSFSDLVGTTGGGHRLLFTHLQTMLSTYLAGWPLKIEAFVNPFLASLSFSLLLLLYRRRSPQLVHVVLIPFSLLLFSLYQCIAWVMSWQSGWHFVNLFFIAALLALTIGRPGWRPLILAAFLVLCATYSRAHGILGWPVVLATMWMRGYRRWWHYVLWGTVTAAVLSVYIAGSGIGIASGSADTWKTVEFSSPLRTVNAAFGQIGAPMGALSYPLATVVGVAGFALLLGNSAYLRLQEPRAEAWKNLSAWLSLAAYAIGSCLLICAARIDVIGEEAVALMDLATTASNMMWVALVALMTMATWRILRQERRRRWHTLLLYANLGIVPFLAALYLQTQIASNQQMALYYGNSLGSEDSRYNIEVERCIVEYPLRRDDSCLGASVAPYIGPSGTKIFMLADYGLSVFAGLEPTPILPQAYRTGSPVVVSTRSPWLNVYVRKYMLPGVPEDLVFHIAPTRMTPPFDRFPLPPGNHWPIVSDEMLDRLEPSGAEVDQVWFITTPESSHLDHPFFDAMNRLGYRETPIEMTQPRYREAKFLVHRLTFTGNDLQP